MPFQPATDTGQAVVTMNTWDNQVVENVWHFDLTVPMTQTVVDAVGDVLADFYNSITGYIFNANTFLVPVMTDIRTETGAQLTYLGGSFPTAGLSGSDPLPGQNAGLVSWGTDFRGASYRGRTYVGGLVESAITSGLMTPATHAALVDAAAYIVASGGFTVLSRQHNLAPRAAAVGKPITSATVHTHMATQRRRSFVS